MSELRRWVTVFRLGWNGERRGFVTALACWRAVFPEAHTGALRDGGRWLTLRVAARDARQATLLALHRVQEFFPPPEFRPEHVVTVPAGHRLAG